MSAPGPRVERLRTGAEVPEPIVRVTQIALDRLMASNPIALYEAVELARDPSHVPFGNTGADLCGLAFTSDSGQMHSAVRDVILACAEGDGFDMRLVSPFADDTAQEASR